MTEPSVRVGSATTAFNLPHNAKPPAGNPIVNSEGDLVEVFKKCFRENGATWIVGVLAMVNILAISIHLERIMVPDIYWDECVAAIRDFCTLTNKTNVEHEVSDFYEFQRALLEQHKTALGEGGGKASSTRSKKAKEGDTAENSTPDADDASFRANSEKIPSYVKFQAWASSDKDVSEVVDDLSGFSAEAHRKLASYIQHTQSANKLVDAQLRKIAGNEISSIIENARLLSSSERKIQAPKLYGIFGLDPYLYLAIQEIRRRAKTNKLEGEALIDADKHYANFSPKKHEDLHGVTSRFDETVRKVVSARNAPIPPNELWVKYIKILEDSSIPIFAGVGRKIRDEIDQRTRTTPGYEPTLDDVKTIGESKYIAAVGRAPAEDSGGGGGGGNRRGALKVSVRGQGGGGDPGPHAAAHLARGRVTTCYNCDKEGHYSRDCPEPRRPRARHKSASRSPSSSNRRGYRQKGSGGGKGSRGGGDATGQAGTQQHSASAATEIATLQLQLEVANLKQQLFEKTAAAASEDPSPGVFN